MSEAFFWKTAEPVYRERLSLITLFWTQQLASLVPSPFSKNQGTRLAVGLCVQTNMLLINFTFTFTDPVEELLLTVGDDTFISTASFREAAEPGCSVELREGFYA